ncbi:MAG: metallophosphoesterase [Bifidobacteriaceae bacterium]|jgi:predicted phosphodiesterase|nr:metallophosphoesterase [Bifidobacteriaceae bacterium]
MNKWRLRVTAWAACALVVAVAGALWGATHARTNYAFGPHQAVYSLTTDGRLTVDLGPVGSVIADSPAPAPFRFVGLRIEVGEIPDNLSSVSMDVSDLTQDLSEYAQFFGALDAVVGEVRQGLVADGARRAALFFSLAMGAAVLLWLALGAQRRNEGYQWVRRHKLITAWVCVVAIVGGGGYGAVRIRSTVQGPDPVAGSPAFAGTPLAGARVTGRLGQVLDYYGSKALDWYENNDRFYDQAAAAVTVAFAEQQWEIMARMAAGQADPEAVEEAAQGDGAASATAGNGVVVPYPESLTATPSGATPSADADVDADPVGGEGDGWQQLEPAARPWLVGPTAYAGLRPVVLVSDLHCNVGLAAVIGATVRASGAVAVFDAGDITADGTSVEAFCVDTFAAAVPEDVPIVVATGNHDTPLTATQAAAAGETVLDGEIVEVADLRLLGDSDPTHTEIAQGTNQVRPETIDEMGLRLAEVACAADPSERADVLLVHNPAAGQAALESGCVPVALFGHTHQRSDPKVVGGGVAYTASSTGKDVGGTTPLGPLKADGELTVLLFDQAGHLVAWQLVTIHPDATATLGPIEALPYPVVAEAEAGGG